MAASDALGHRRLPAEILIFRDIRASLGC